jgi:hypothetical protein
VSMKLLSLVESFDGCCGGVEVAVDAPGEVALEDAADFAVGLALCVSSFGVGAGLGVVHRADHGDGGQGAVEASVAAVESVADGVF